MFTPLPNRVTAEDIARAVPRDHLATRYEGDSRVTQDGIGGLYVEHPNGTTYHVRELGAFGWCVCAGDDDQIIGGGELLGLVPARPATHLPSADLAVKALIGNPE